MFDSPTFTFSQDDAMRPSVLTAPLKNFARPDRPFRHDALLMQSFFADRIAQSYRVVNDLQHRDIRFASDFQTADAVLPADGARGVDRAGGNDLFEAQTQRQEFGQ